MGVGGDLFSALIVLALIDSTSFGTLLIPLWLLATPGRIRPARLLLYLGTIATFYLLLGLTLFAGASTVLAALDDVTAGRWASWLQLVVGVALIVAAFAVPSRRKATGGGRDRGRAARWRDTLVSGEGTGGRAVVAVALGAGLVEAATMLPYLAAVGILSAEAPSPDAAVALLVGYCAVMVLPAVLLLAARIALGDRPVRTLAAIERWMSRNARETLLWLAAIVGFYIAADAAQRLGLVAWLESL